ncbi:MinD/ParA family protein [Microbacterium sp. CCNWLW134]|uniref:MinD/ParA family ATP-binding protein n=1 Tax=Microbacterium sp. CCNWLW134 TaxID=3122064 RepID=UPI0030100B7D
MTPDAFDETPEDDDENGVLPDTVSIDTTALGVLSGQTAQVSVILPSSTDDDALDDEDVVDDEIPPATDDAEIPVREAPDAADTDSPVSGPIAIEPPAETAEAEIVEDDAQPEHADDDAHAAHPDHVDAEIVEDALEPATAVAAAAGGAAAETTASDPVPATTASADVVSTPTSAGPASGISARTTRTGSVPATRWELQHPDQPERPQRARSAERVTTRNEVALSSKRLGEFEGGRETPDLLTADRLLDQRHLVRAEPEGMWRHLVYSLTGRRVNLGDSKRARARKELDRRIGAPLTGGARFVPVLSRKGGVGKTTVTTLLGMALADARDDRVIAVDANPDRGTLAERIARANGKTVRDLARARSEVSGYNDISQIVARDETRLDVLASDADPRVSEAFSDRDYHDVATLAAHYYSIVLTDTGTGIVHSVMGATLELADQLVVVAGLSVDEARLASETLTWLETNGYAEHVKNAVVVLNNSRPGPPVVRPDELEIHFRSRVRAVVRMPFDPQIAAGSAITFRDLQPATRLAARELAATVVEGLRTLAPAA